MNNFMNKMKEFLNDEEGLTVVEYVVGAGLLVAGLTGIFSTFSSTLTTELGNVFSS
ncbi:Flp family type IVb pilin [Vibrio paucivorans]